MFSPGPYKTLDWFYTHTHKTKVNLKLILFIIIIADKTDENKLNAK